MVLSGETLDHSDVRQVVLKDGADVRDPFSCHRVEGPDSAIVGGDHQTVDGERGECDERELPAEGEEQHPYNDDRADVYDDAFNRVGHGVLQGLDICGRSRHQLPGAAHVEEPQGESLKVVVDFRAQGIENVLAGLLQEEAVQDVEHQETASEHHQELEIALDAGRIERIADVDALGYVDGKDIVNHVAHHVGLDRIQPDRGRGAGDSDDHTPTVGSDVGNQSEEDVHTLISK